MGQRIPCPETDIFNIIYILRKALWVNRDGNELLLCGALEGFLTVRGMQTKRFESQPTITTKGGEECKRYKITAMPKNGSILFKCIHSDVLWGCSLPTLHSSTTSGYHVQLVEGS